MGDMTRCARCATYHYRNDPCPEELDAMTTEEHVHDLLATMHTYEVRIVRRKHRIGVWSKSTVGEIIHKLQGLPPGATVDEVVPYERDHYPGLTTIEFHEERVEEDDSE